MPLLSTIFKTILVVFLILSATIFFLLKVNYTSKLTFNNETIHVSRNQYGMPYLKAQSFESAMYGWGYVTAEDRLFMMAFKRLITKGHVSKYVGKKALSHDKLFRELNFNYWAQKTVQNLKTNNITQYRNFESFTKGINDYVKSLTFMPIQFKFLGLQWQEWKISDIFIISKLLVWSQSNNMAQQYIRSSLLKNYTMEQINELIPWKYQQKRHKGKKVIVTDQEYIEQMKKSNKKIQDFLDFSEFLPQEVQSIIEMGLMQFFDEGRGSNSWVISGNLTQSGLPLLANDPHLDNTIPAQWHQIRIQYLHNNNTVFMQGSAMTGLPLIIGRNEYVSIGVTTVYADTQDLYKQKIVEENGIGYYMLDDKKIKLKQRTEIIQIENQPALVYIVRQTHRGPIINFIGHTGKIYQLKNDQHLSLAWVGFHDQYEFFTTFSHFGEIVTLDNLKVFLNQYTDYGSNTNIFYATKDNHIGYAAIGSLPIRKNVQSGVFVKDGSTLKSDWIGLIQKQHKLQVHDPKKGYILNGNNKPASTIYQNGVYDTSIYTARADRIQEMIVDKINKGKKMNVENMKEFQLDTIDVYCRINLPFLLQGVKGMDEYLGEFDCDFTMKSYQATVYQVFYYQLYLIINPDKVNNFNLLSNHHFNSYLHEYSRNISQISVKENMKKALKNTIKNLQMFFGNKKKQQWRWSVYHQDVISHRPFSGSQVLRKFYQKRFGGRGNINTVNVAKMNKLAYGDFSCNHRANVRMIWSYGQKSYWILDTGVSEKFYSKHYDDQHKLFVKDQYVEVGFNKKFIGQDEL